MPNNQAAIYTEQVISDTQNWVLVSGWFIADAAYEYIVIGNFFDDAHTTVETITTLGHGGSYCYIDDVCVSADSTQCNVVIPFLPEDTIGFPPHDDSTAVNVPSEVNVYYDALQKTIKLTLPDGATRVEIYNDIGQLVYTDIAFALQPIIDVRAFSSSVYFVRVHSHQGVQTQKFVVQR